MRRSSPLADAPSSATRGPGPRPLRGSAAVAVAMVLALAAAGEQRAVGQQDTFTPLAVSTVTLGTVDTDAADTGSVSTTITPADPRSVKVVEVPATVSVPGGVTSDLAEVTLCLYLVAAGDAGCAPNGGLSAEWADEDPDPADRAVLTWRPDRVTTDGGGSVTDHGFAVVGSNLHLDASSTSDLNDLAAGATDVTVTFRFRTSVALRAADGGYAVRVVALDTNGNHSADASTQSDWEQTGLTVSVFRSATTSRSPMAFGALLPGAATIVEDVSSGEFVANAPSALTIEATDFTYDEDDDGTPESTIALRGSAGEPTSDPAELAIDCNAGATFDANSALRLTTNAQQFEGDLYSTGTGESGDARTHSCRLDYGGGATAIGQEHGGTIAITIAPGS